tara:strand:- start:10589 stop:11011 length:423 start_codon:yes stop_codon:yes gene_type:complete
MQNHSSFGAKAYLKSNPNAHCVFLETAHPTKFLDVAEDVIKTKQALPNLMRVVWTTVNRTSRSGKIIGEGERLTPYEALKAITIWSAYQHFEEDSKGTLEKGKLGDLVILDKNPLKVAPDDIKDINVVETIKDGVIVFQK